MYNDPRTLTQYIQSLLDVVKSFIYKKKEYSTTFPFEFTFFQVVERIYFNLETLILLLRDTPLKFDHGIGLISRNILSDFINIGYAISFSSNQSRTEFNLLKLYYSDLKKSDSYARKYLMNVEYNDKTPEVSLNEYLKKRDDPASFFSKVKYMIFQRTNGNEPEDYPGMGQIFDKCLEWKKNNKNYDPNFNEMSEAEMLEFTKSIWKEHIFQAYNLWIALSKYEHFGYYSYSLSRLKHTEVDNNLLKIINKSSLLLSYCLKALNDEERSLAILSIGKEKGNF